MCNIVSENLGYICNIITSVCAVIAIWVSLSENRKLREQTERLEEKRFKASSFEKIGLETSGHLLDLIYNTAKENLNQMKAIGEHNDNRELYDEIDEKMQILGTYLRLLKQFDIQLYKRCAEQVEKDQDTLAKFINKGKITNYQIKQCLRELRKNEYKLIDELYKYEREIIWEIK